MIYKTYRGAKLDIEAYKGKATIDYEVEVDYDSGAAYDFSIYASLVCEIFYRKDGETVLTPTLTSDENFLLFNLTTEQSAGLQKREYYYECYGVYADDEEEPIIYGTLKVI